MLDNDHVIEIEHSSIEAVSLDVFQEFKGLQKRVKREGVEDVDSYLEKWGDKKGATDESAAVLPYGEFRIIFSSQISKINTN